MTNGSSMNVTLKDNEKALKPEPKPESKSIVKSNMSDELKLYKDIEKLWTQLSAAVVARSLHRAKKPYEKIKKKYKELFL